MTDRHKLIAGAVGIVVLGLVAAGGIGGLILLKRQSQDRDRQAQMDADYFDLHDVLTVQDALGAYAAEWDKGRFSPDPLFNADSGRRDRSEPAEEARRVRNSLDRTFADLQVKFAASHGVDAKSWGQSFVSRYPARDGMVNQVRSQAKDTAVRQWLQYRRDVDALRAKTADSDYVSRRAEFCESEARRLVGELRKEVEELPSRREMRAVIYKAAAR